MFACTVDSYPGAQQNPRHDLRLQVARWWCAGTLAAALGCTGNQPPRDADLEISVTAESTTLDPRFATRALDVKLSRLVHGSLVRLDPDTLEPIPYLAERLSYRSDRCIEVSLRANARFHSGAPLTARDVCATLSALATPELASPHQSVVSSFTACSEHSASELRLCLSGSRATWMTDLEVPILRADQARSPRELGSNLDGLGRFRVDAFEPGRVRLLPADNGVEPPPKAPVIVRTFRDETARTMSLLSGQSTILELPQSLTLLSGRAFDGVFEVSRPGANVTYLLIHNQRPDLDRPEVRQALSLGIDRRLIVERLYGGHAKVARSLVPPTHWAAPKDLPVLPYEPEVAAGVLASLRPMTILSSTDRSRVLVARAVAQMLTDLGLLTRVVPLDLGVLLARLDQGHYDLAILQIPEFTEPNVLTWFFHHRNIPDGAKRGGNRARYTNPAAGRLLDLASEEFDRAGRQKLYTELLQLLRADMPVCPLWHEDQVALVRARARSFRSSAEGRWSSLADLE